MLWDLGCTLGRRHVGGFVREILRRGREGMLAFSAFSFVLDKSGLGLTGEGGQR